MSESDGVTLTTFSTPEPKSDAEHQADLRREVRHQQELELLTIRMHGAARPTKKLKKRKPDAASDAQLRYARIREIPREVSLKECCKRFDAMQRPFRTPKAWQGEGCPPTWGEAWKNSDWRKKIHDLHQTAWRSENLPDKLV
jgi:hypothetical protein